MSLDNLGLEKNHFDHELFTSYLQCFKTGSRKFIRALNRIHLKQGRPRMLLLLHSTLNLCYTWYHQ